MARTSYQTVQNTKNIRPVSFPDYDKATVNGNSVTYDWGGGGKRRVEWRVPYTWKTLTHVVPTAMKNKAPNWGERYFFGSTVGNYAGAIYLAAPSLPLYLLPWHCPLSIRVSALKRRTTWLIINKSFMGPHPVHLIGLCETEITRARHVSMQPSIHQSIHQAKNPKREPQATTPL